MDALLLSVVQREVNHYVFRRGLPWWQDADDLLQDVWIIVNKRMAGFDPKRGEMGRRISYLAKVSIAEVLRSKVGRNGHRRAVGKSDQPPPLAQLSQIEPRDTLNGNPDGDKVKPTNYEQHTEAAPESSAELKDLWNWLSQSLDRKRAMAVQLYYLDGVTMLECGRAIGFSESRTWQLLNESRALLRLRLLLSPQCLG